MGEYSRTVPPEGSTDSKIAFVGEAPAYNEVMEGRPFVGKSGQQFNDFLLHARITRKETYITNLFKVPVQKTSKPEKYWVGNTLLYSAKGGFTEEGMKYVHQLYDELKGKGFNLIVPMGNPATYALVGKMGITKVRGSLYWSKEVEKKVMPTIHPAASMHQYLYKYYIISDFRRAREQGEFPELKFKERHYTLKPSYNNVTLYLDNVTGLKKPTAFDIEVMRGEVSCISMSCFDTDAIVIPFHYEGQPFYSLEEEAEIWRKIGLVLEDEGIKKVGQNLSFDTTFLYEKYGIVTRNVDDTMVAHRMTFPDFPAGLDFQTSMYTDIPYYKDEGKQYIKWGGSDDDFLLYNAKDSIVCIETMPQLIEDLKRIGNYESYVEQVKLLQPVSYMGLRGLRVDVDGVDKWRDELQSKIDKNQETLNKIVGAELNANSPKQVATYFYIGKGITPYKDKGKITTNEGALKRIARRGFDEARVILKIRSDHHTISTYLNVKLDGDRLRCSYDPAKKTGRLGSSEDIFGYGTNMQNQPQSMNRLFLADEGHLIYTVDLSQADNRSVAYIAPEPRMIQAFEDGVDVHSLTAHFIFGIPADEIKQMDKEGIKCELGYGDQTHRHWGKGANHKLNFGMTYQTFAYELELPEKQGKEIWEKYHRTYPGVQKSFHKMVKDQLQKNRMLTNAFGRKYLFLDRWSDKLFNQAYAFIPQSNTADIINRHGIIPIYYDRKKYKEVELLRQVHDSLDFQIPLSIGVKTHARILRDIKRDLEQPITWKAYTFVIPAEFKVGHSLDPMMKIDMDGDVVEQLKAVEGK